MGERGGISRYAYWSDRRIRGIASDNGIAVERRLRWRAKIRTIPFFPEFEVGQESATLGRAEIARRLEVAIGDHAVEDFVTPPSARFAKGIGRVSFAQLAGVSTVNDGVVVHTRVRSSTGVRVAVCLFGSLDNMAGYVGASDKTGGGWVSSAAEAIYLLVASRGTVNTSQWTTRSQYPLRR